MKREELPANILFVDIETESGVDLPKLGVGRYFADPFTRVTVVAYAEGEKGEVQAADFTQCYPDLFEKMMGADMIVAHNATFDFLGLPVMQDYTDKKLCCTRAMCALLNLPEALKDAAEAVNKNYQKLEKPELLQTGQTGLFDYANATDEQKEEFLEYNRKDVEAMRELFYRLIENIPAHELDAIDAHLRINMRGMPLDAGKLEEAYQESKKEREELAVDFKVRWGFNISQVEEIKNYINAKYNLKMQSGSAAALMEVEKYLEEDDQAMVRQRLKLSHNENAKLEKIKKRADTMDQLGDSKLTLRDELVFAKAVTGRWSSKGAQMHNNRRGGMVKQLIVAPRGWEMYVADFSQVELRIALWVAGALEGVKEVHKGSFYEDVAARVYGKQPSEVSKVERFMGKQLALGCNYGMGPERFVATCRGYGTEVPIEEADRLVRLYRNKVVPQIPKCWEALQAAAVRTMRTGRKAVPDGTRGVSFEYVGNGLELLKVKLPTGRYIHYWNARLGEDDKGRPYIEFVDPSRKNAKPTITNGGHWLENLSQAISRDLMARSLVRFSQENMIDLRVIMHVHDELVALVKKKTELHDQAKLDEIMLDPKFREGDGVNGLLLDVESHMVKRWGDAK